MRKVQRPPLAVIVSGGLGPIDIAEMELPGIINGDDAGPEFPPIIANSDEVEGHSFSISEDDTEEEMELDLDSTSSFDLNKFEDAFQQAVEDIGPLKIKYSGVTASPSCILVQGFPDNEQLNILRDKLRLRFKKTNLYTTIDLRYEISTAHATVVRFSAPLRNRDEFIEVLSKYRKSDFGTLEVDRLDLVFNNWYQDLSVTKQLSRCELRSV